MTAILKLLLHADQHRNRIFLQFLIQTQKHQIIKQAAARLLRRILLQQADQSVLLLGIAGQRHVQITVQAVKLPVARYFKRR